MDDTETHVETADVAISGGGIECVPTLKQRKRHAISRPPIFMEFSKGFAEEKQAI